MTLDSEQLEELIAAFREEAKEHFGAIDEFLDSIRNRRAGDPDLSIEKAVAKARLLKETALVLEFEKVTKSSGELLSGLEGLLKSDETIDSKIVDDLFATLNKVKKAVDEIGSSDEAARGDGAQNSPGEKEPTEKKKKGASPFSGLQQDQFDQLTAVFKAESAEHIRALSELLISLEQGEGDLKEMFTRAFREAHSLKGAAGTLGYCRVEAVTHHLEDVIGQLMRKERNLFAEEADLLLSALDVIAESVDTSELGDEKLNPKESMIATALEELTGDLEKADLGGEEASQPAKQKAAPAKPAQDVIAKEVPRVVASQKEVEAPRNDRMGDELIRISQEKIDTVIARLFELFEANLQLESLGPALFQLADTASEVGDVLKELKNELEGESLKQELNPALERIGNLTSLAKNISKQFDRDERLISKLILGSQEDLRKIRMAPISSIFTTIRRQVRGISRALDKPLELDLLGGEYMVDRKVLDAIEEPLVHVLRNAASHGIEDLETRKRNKKPEAGRIGVTSKHMGDAVEITVTDDGRGIDPELIRQTLLKKKGMTKGQVDKLSEDQLMDYLFEPGFSTQQGVSKISGRGVGLDVVKFTVEQVGGEVRLESEIGVGTAITMRLPLAMSTVRCLLVRTAGRVLAIPAANILKVIVPSSEDIKLVGGAEVISFKEQNIPLGSLGDVLRLASGGPETLDKSKLVLIIAFGERRYAFVVDDLIEYTQLILKPLGDLLERVPNISGISLLGTGETAIVLNPADLVRSAGGVRKEGSKPIFPGLLDTTQNKRVLVVDDSIATRTLEKTLLESAGFLVLTASDGYRALDTLANNKCDIVLSDVNMPNMDGIELARTIKSRPKLSHLPVILITSLGSDEDKSRGLAAGADAYIVKKELTQNELIETINQLL